MRDKARSRRRSIAVTTMQLAQHTYYHDCEWDQSVHNVMNTDGENRIYLYKVLLNRLKRYQDRGEIKKT